jgi:hypothetical protein
MAEIFANSGTEWSWANVVLTKPSRYSPHSKPPRNLSTRPERSIIGQMDRLSSTFETRSVADPEHVSDLAYSRRAATALSCGKEPAAMAQQCETRRQWAERCVQLNPDHPPGDVPQRRWHRLIKDIGEFVDGGWAEKAAVLGWALGDLVGADRDKPFARLDKAGLLWLLNGNRIIAMCENTATIEAVTGARQTWRRKANQPDLALAWELAGKVGSAVQVNSQSP